MSRVVSALSRRPCDVVSAPPRPSRETWREAPRARPPGWPRLRAPGLRPVTPPPFRTPSRPRSNGFGRPRED